MAINFPATTGEATDGSFTHTASGITWSWDGTTWNAQGVTGTYSLPTASATVLGGIKVGSNLTIGVTEHLQHKLVLVLTAFLQFKCRGKTT